MEQDEYLEKRLENQINWYDKKSQTNHSWYKWLRILEIIFAASIPFLTGSITADTPKLKLFVGFVGVLIVIITGIVSLCKLQENWIEYRTTCESLRHEKYLFLNKCGIYQTADDPFCLLVQRVEELISKEHSTWTEYTKDTGKKG